MTDVLTPETSHPNQPEAANSPVVLKQEAARYQITWARTLLVLVGRSVLILAAPAVVALLSWSRTHNWSWNGAAKWWTVYGTLVDAGCLALMMFFTRKEGIRLRDLIGRVRVGRDLLIGIGCLLIVLPFFFFGGPLAGWIVYRTFEPPLFPGMLVDRALPLWGLIYSLTAWWLIWSPTEEVTYQGFALPRIEALTGSRWKAVALVAFWWALQHSFIPSILDWRYVAWRFLAFLPGVLVFTLIYLRIRRLAPLIVAHWSMDIIGTFFTLRF